MPDRLVISNTSPLLYLHQIGRIDLLATLYGAVIAPPAVAQELRVGAEKGVDVPDLSALPWVEVRPVTDPKLLPVVIDLGSGEAEVIALGIENPDSLLILDDKLARRIAGLRGLSLTGTLGVLIKARKEGHLSRLAPALNDLRSTTIRIHEDLYRFALVEANELDPD